MLGSWLDQIDAHKHYDYVVFDCPPATKIVSQNALAASDSYVIPVIPDDLSSRGVTHFRNLVQTKIDGKFRVSKNQCSITDSDTPKNFVPTTTLPESSRSLVKHTGRAELRLYEYPYRADRIASRTWKNDMIQTVLGENMIGVPESVNSGLAFWKFDVKMFEGCCEKMVGPRYAKNSKPGSTNSMTDAIPDDKESGVLLKVLAAHCRRLYLREATKPFLNNMQPVALP